MSKLRALNISVSEDGYMAGPNQSLENPMGENGMALHKWALATRTFQEEHGGTGGSTGVDDDFIRSGTTNIGATIMGRNMFGPVRGEWPDETWRGWWGEEPVYKHPVFVLTHFPRERIEFQNGTSFTFVTDGIVSALNQARVVAGLADIRLGGGARTLIEYVKYHLLDELHLAVSPIILGGGERIFVDLKDGFSGYELEDAIKTEDVTHMTYLRK